MRKTKNLTEGNLYKNFFLFAIPLVLAQLLSLSYNIIDSMIAGKFINNYAVGAVGATHMFDVLIITMFGGFSVGFSIYISRLFGEKNYVKIKNDIINILIFIFCCGLVVGILCIVFNEQIISFFKIDDEIKQDSLNYFLIHKAGIVFIVLQSTFLQILNSLGVSSFVFLMSALSAVLNIGGNLLCVIVFKIGTAGLAFATIFSAFVVCISYIIKLNLIFKELNVQKEKVKISFDCVKKTFKFSVPTCMQQMIMYLSSVIISPAINAIGPAATTGYAVSYKMFDIPTNVYWASSKTVAVFAAQSIGSKKYDVIQKGLFVGIVQSLALTMPFILLCVFGAGPISSIFFEDGYSGEAFNYAVTFGMYFMPFILFNVINNIAHNFFRGMKLMKMLLVSTAIGSVSKLVLILSLVPVLSMNGVFLGWILSWIIECLFCIVVYVVKLGTKEKIIKTAMNS